MFYGYVVLGSNLFGMLLTLSGATPTAPDAAPTYRIYGPGGALMTNGTGTMTLGDQTGLYYFTKAIVGGDGYIAGQTYTVKVAYAISSVAKGELETFTVT